jgi:hypothetical protein
MTADRGEWDLRPSCDWVRPRTLAVMEPEDDSSDLDTRAGPWFRRHPRQAVAVAAAMFVAIFGLRMAETGAADAVSVLYVLPVALLAITFGFIVGSAAGVGAVALLFLGVDLTGIPLTALGWSTRITPLLLLGPLIGFASDQLQQAEQRERHYDRVALLQREAAEINDDIVQRLAAAKWLLEAGNTDRGLEAVADTMVAAQALVSRMLGADSPLGGGRRQSRRPNDAPHVDRGVATRRHTDH